MSASWGTKVPDILSSGKVMEQQLELCSTGYQLESNWIGASFEVKWLEEHREVELATRRRELIK